MLLDVAPIATIISDQTGLIKLVNVQAEKLLMYGREELTGQRVELLVPEYARNSHADHRLTYVTAPRVRPMGLGMALYAKRKDGSAVPVEIELSYSEEQIEQRLDKIKGQVAHLKDIMEDVLMLARIQAKRVEFAPTKLDLDALTRSILDEFESHTDIRHRLEYTVNERNREVWLDYKLMRHMISNLVSNAIKYSPEGNVVRIHLEYSDSEVTLSVSDEGIGIPDADRPHLFEPFHRAANVGTISGTGPGLVITREAVDLHGGTITVESQQGVGTTFLIRIPISAGGGQQKDEAAHP